LILWFVVELRVDYVGKVTNVMDTTQVGFCLDIQISPFGVLVVCLDLQVMEPIGQLDLQTMVPIWPPTMGLEPLQLVQVFMTPLEVAMVLIWCAVKKLLSWEVTICIYFLLLVIVSLSSSYESSVVICSLVRICLGDLLDEARGHLTYCNLFFNFEVLALDVEASCIPVGTTFSGLC
jgi:hypothetical protein